MAQKGILSCSIDDKQELYRCYMPFLQGGVLTLMGEERMAIPGRVAWVTPQAGSKSGINSGVGVQFQETAEGEQAQSRIASELAGMLDSDRPTHTL